MPKNMTKPKPKYPKCEEYLKEKVWRAYTYWEKDDIEDALSKAEENGMLEGYKQGEEKRADLIKQLAKSRKFLGKKDRRIQKLKAELSK